MTTKEALLIKIKAQKDGLAPSKIPMIQKHEMHELIADGAIEVMTLEKHGRQYTKLVAR